MSQDGGEPEVVALVVPKRSGPRLSGGGGGDDGDTQNDGSLCSQNQSTRPNDHNEEVEEDHRDDSYFQDRDSSHSNSQTGSLVSDQSSYEERNNNHLVSETNYKQEGQAHDNLEHQHQHQQDNYPTGAGQYNLKYFIYPEHSYQRQDMGISTGDSCYHLYNEANAADKNTPPAETHVTAYPESGSYIELENVAVEGHEHRQERTNEYFEDCSNAYPRSGEVNECAYSERGHAFQAESNYNQVPIDDRYYNYELRNDNFYQGEANVPTVQLSKEESYNYYQPDEGNVYDGDEPADSHRENRNHIYHLDNFPDKTKINDKNTYQERKFQDDGIVQNQTNIHEEDGKESIREELGTSKRQDSSAVDLRMFRPLSHASGIQNSYESIQNPENTSLLSNGFGSIENPRVEASTQITYEEQNYNSSKSSYIVPGEISPEEEYNSSTQHQLNEESFECSIYQPTVEERYNSWDATTNTEPFSLEDKETQTEQLEKKDTAVQTDVQPKSVPFSFLQSIRKDLAKYTCPICQRVYISKSSYDRHLRTHDKEKNNNIITNVRFTTEAKLQICKRAGKMKHLKTRGPLIIHVPRSIFQCDMCNSNFSNQREKDNHECSFQPFTMTKCSECHIKFYTTSALNEHIKRVHKKENAYYCIFYNKSFDAGYNFHLHLDEHLSAQ